MNMLEIKNLGFGYNSERVLKDISFNIKKGEFVSIIGPNGSGKSTLLKTLNGLYKIDNGTILLDGKELNKYKSRDMARSIALVPQDTNVSYEFTVEEIVMMGRHPYKGRFDREDEDDLNIIYESMRLTNTFNLKERLITEISGGERQRVFIARALAQKSSVILLDEPTSHLDINHQMDVLNLLRDLNKEQGITIVLVIHDINLAARYSDWIILLKNGVILGKGTPNEVITSENVEMTYDIKVAVDINKYTNSPYLTPIEKTKNPKCSGIKVHIISGGGTGQKIVNRLYSEGYNITMGVLNVGDSDWSLGKSLSIPIAEEAPFTGISKRAYEKNMDYIKEAEIILLMKVPIGSGNIKNYQAAEEALNMGKKVFLIEDDSYREFDYTGGEGIKLLNRMKDKGLRILENEKNLSLEVLL